MDVENTFIQAFGERMLSRSGVSRIALCLQQDFDTWRKRDLSELEDALPLPGCYLPSITSGDT
jgi:hypothetical protein